MDRDDMPLAECAMALHRGYQQTRDLILRGLLDGYQDARGRWLVSRASLDRYVARERARQQTAGEKVPA